MVPGKGCGDALASEVVADHIGPDRNRELVEESVAHRVAFDDVDRSRWSQDGHRSAATGWTKAKSPDDQN
jgi:hypothetical protein